MLRTIIKPWWAIMLMGVLFIISAILMFNNPAATMLAVAFWLGWLALLAGIAGIASYFSSPKDERQIAELLTGAGTVILGFLMISKSIITIKAITMVFGILVVSIGIWLISFAWRVRSQWTAWWIAGLLGLIAILIGIKNFWDIQAGAETISNLMGIGVLLSGIGLLVLGYTKRKVVHNVKDKVAAFKSSLK